MKSKRQFIAESDREKYLMKKLWETVIELDETLRQYVPVATMRSDAAENFISHLRKIFPEIHKKITNRRVKEMMGILNETPYLPKVRQPSPKP